MANWLQALRLNQIHDPNLLADMDKYTNPQPLNMEATDMPDQSGPIMTPEGDFNYGDPPTGINAYQPEHTATDRFNELIKGYPERQKPSFLRTIAASLSAFGKGGTEAAQGVMDEPNIRAMTDWKNKLGPAQQAANLERQSNTNERALAQQQSNLERQLAVDAERERHNREVEETANARLDGYKELTTAGGEKFLYNAHTGDLKRTGVQSGTMTTQAKLDDQQSAAQELVKLQAEQQRITNKEKDDAKAAAKLAATQQTDAQKQAIKDRTQETINTIDTLLDKNSYATPDGVPKLTSMAQSAVGPSRTWWPTQLIPGTEGKKGDVAINNLKSNLILDVIAQMKAQSKTGATGFGNMQLKELAVIENAANQLDTSIDEDSFAAELKKIRDKLVKVLEPETGSNPTVIPGNTKVTKPGSVVKPPSPAPTAAELILKYGG